MHNYDHDILAQAYEPISIHQDWLTLTCVGLYESRWLYTSLYHPLLIRTSPYSSICMGCKSPRSKVAKFWSFEVEPSMLYDSIVSARSHEKYLICFQQVCRIWRFVEAKLLILLMCRYVDYLLLHTECTPQLYTYHCCENSRAPTHVIAYIYIYIYMFFYSH